MRFQKGTTLNVVGCIWAVTALFFLLASTRSENGNEDLLSQEMCKKLKTVIHTQCQCTANQNYFLYLIM